MECCQASVHMTSCSCQRMAHNFCASGFNLLVVIQGAYTAWEQVAAGPASQLRQFLKLVPAPLDLDSKSVGAAELRTS